MKLKKGDKVIVITGKDKGKTGTIQKCFPKVNKVVVDGVNLRKKHKKPSANSGTEGQIVEIYAPIDASNVQIVDPKTKKPSRIRIEEVNGKKVRVSVKSNTKLD